MISFVEHDSRTIAMSGSMIASSWSVKESSVIRRKDLRALLLHDVTHDFAACLSVPYQASGHPTKGTTNWVLKVNPGHATHGQKPNDLGKANDESVNVFLQSF